jgi:hypothetical protein
MRHTHAHATSRDTHDLHACAHAHAKVGVGGAKGFFEQKAAAQNADAQMQEKDRQYREQVKQQNEEKKASRAAFKEKAALFQ